MNHIFRVVWNAGLGAWVAASECAKGKACSRSDGVLGSVALSIATFGLTPLAWAAGAGQPTVQSVTAGTTAYVADNGVTVFHIANPNAQGLSRNQFTQYNVDAKGLVLNNATTSAGLTAVSTLAGRVAANTQLQSSATVILNEVVSNNRSTLAGFTEVLGNKADVIVANPYGITCSGCGFINTDRVTLSTGTPRFASDGRFEGLDVSRGDIRITGDGLNASAQQVLDLVTRSVSIEAQVHAQDLMLTLGSQGWRYADRSATGQLTTAGETPLYALDSTVLGGMYAGRIRLLATEAGVGVRMRGDAVTSQDEIQVSSAGRIELLGRLSANTSVKVSGQADVQLASASVAARDDIALSAAGALSLSDSNLVAEHDLTVSAASLSDQASGSERGLRQAGRNLDVDVSGAASVDGANWLSAGDWSGRFGVLTLGSGAFSAGGIIDWNAQGPMELGRAALRSVADLSLRSGGVMSDLSDAGQGIQSTKGNIRVSAYIWRHAGELSADAGNLTVQSDVIEHSGNSVAKGDVQLAGWSSASVGLVSNSGLLQADGQLDIEAGRLENLASGWIQAAQGSQVKAGSLLQAGTWLLSTEAAAVSRVTSGDVVNSGAMQSAGSFTLSASSLRNQGQLLSQGDVTLSLSDNLNNEAGASLQTQGRLSLTTALWTQAGAVYASAGLSANAGSNPSPMTWVNSGLTLSGADLSVQAGKVNNSGQVQAETGSDLQASSLAQSGTWILSTKAGGGTDQLTVTGQLDNAGNVQSAQSLAVVAAGLHNTGSVATEGDLGLLVQGGTLLNDKGAQLGAKGTLSATVQGYNALVNESGAQMAGDTVKLHSDTVTVNRGSVLATQAVEVITNNMDNQGVVYGGKRVTLAGLSGLANSFSNTKQWLSGGDMTLAARTLYNGVDATVQAGQGMSVQGGDWLNSGLWLTSTQASGQVDTFALTGQAMNWGTLSSAQDVLLTADNLFNAKDMVAGGQMNVRLTGTGSILLTNLKTGWIQAKGMVVNSAHGVSNTGTIAADTDALTVKAESLDNLGTLYGASALSLTTAGEVHNAAKALMNTAGMLWLDAGAFVNDLNGRVQATTGTVADLGSLSQHGSWVLSSAVTSQTWPSALTVSGNAANSGSIDSSGDVTLTAASLDNSGQISSAGRRLTVDVGAGTLHNSKLMVATTGTMDVKAKVLDNEGTLLSQGSLTVDAAQTQQSDNGKMLSLGDLTINGGSLDSTGRLGANGQLTVSLTGALRNSGEVQAAQALSVEAQSLELYSDGLLQGDSVHIKTGVATLSGKATVRAQQNLDLTASSLTLQDSDSRVLAAMGAAEGDGGTISVAGSLSNQGLIYSAGALDVHAGSIDNAQGAAISGAGTTTVSSDANFANQGLLWSGGLLTLNALKGTFSNVGTADEAVGQVEAKDLAINADQILNTSSIHASQDANLKARVFSNRMLGDLSINVTYYSDQTKVENWTVDGPALDLWEYWRFTRTWVAQESFASGVPAFRPLISASGSLSITGFDTATNLGGTLSAQTMNIVGAQASATFENRELVLHRYNYTQTYTVYTHWVTGAKISAHEANVRGATVTNRVEAPNSRQTYVAGLYAGTLNASDFNLSLSGGTDKVQSTVASQPSANGGAGSGTPSGSAFKDEGYQSASVEADTAPKDSTDITPVDNPQPSAGTVAHKLDPKDIGLPSGVSQVDFGGLSLNLPQGSNGLYVTVGSPSARYLVETNPLYLSSGSFAGSDLLTSALGYDPDKLIKRLGDGNYEAYTVAQQVLAQTGRNWLAGKGYSDAEQMKALMADASQQAKGLGLVYGEPLSSTQQASLAQDIVWMVKTQVGDQVVLSPVVYLSPKTLASIQTGSVIAANDMNLNLSSLTNTGGTLSASKSMTVVSAGDIRNLSGTITGGNISLTSTQGSIVNQTLAQEINGQTVLARDAAIAASGNLALDAGQAIKNIGAQMSAGGSASLVAKDSITFDTIAQKSTSSTSSQSSKDGKTTVASSTTETVTQHKSGLTVGADLIMDTSKEIVLAGTDVTAAGNAKLQAKDGISVINRMDTTQTTSQSKEEGWGVGGGVWGTSTTKETTDKGRTVASTLKVGGDLTAKTDKDITIQGAKVDVGGAGDLQAQNINVLAGQDYDRSTKTTSTTSLLKVVSGQTQGESDASAQAKSKHDGKTQEAHASAGAEASASGSGTGGLAFVSNTETTSTRNSERSRGSSLSFGQGASIQASKDITLEGSSLKAGGDLALSAENVTVKAGRNVDTSSTKTTETNIGLMAKTDSDAGANAGARAGADRVTSVTGNASASAEAGAQANTESGVRFVDVKSTTTTTDKLTHDGSVIEGGNVRIKANNKVAVEGSSVNASGDLAIQAKSLEVSAVADHDISKTEKVDVGIGLMGSSKNGVQGGVSASTGNVTNASATAEGEASSANKLSWLRAETSTETSKTVTHQGASLGSGGNLKVDVSGDLKVKGSSLSSEGSATIQAANQSFEAVHDVKETSRTTNVTTAGMYLDASAKAGAKGQAMAGADASASVEVGGFVNNSGSSKTEGATTAKVSTITTKGDLTRIATGEIKDVGTAIDVGGNLTQKAETIVSKAAADTTYSSSGAHAAEGRYGMYAGASAEASVTGGADADASIGARWRADYSQSSSSSTSSTAVASTVKVGGNVDSRSSGLTHLEGTKLDAGGDVTIGAGQLKVTAARDTTTSQSTEGKGGVAVTVNVNAKSVLGGEVSVAGEGSNSQSASSTAQVASLSSGGKLKIVSTGDANFEGTVLKGKESASIDAGGKVNFDAATSTSSETTHTAGASVGIGGSTGGKADKDAKNGTVSAEANYQYTNAQSATQTAGSIEGGTVSISSGGDTRLVGTTITAERDVGIASGGALTIEAKQDKSESQSGGFGISMGASGGTSKAATAGDTQTDKSVTGGTSVNVDVVKTTDAQGASITSKGGNVRLSSGKDTTLVGTQVSAEQGKASVQAGGQVLQKEARSTHEAGGATVGLTMEVSETSTAPAGTTPPPKGSTKSTSKARPKDVKAGFNANRRDQSQATKVKAQTVEIQGQVKP
ncbi:hemagglutinin repeat-containing protein [Aquabacterium sp.]|uniref:hemagglutinin repeat-containing protein n=1 Tax=Aquabacterium sp. TaxID=1872578 RepID=UPI0025BA9DE4|nr:hemagglutinin repeat-containing protein [Aquabacterium sp.]